MTTRLEALRQVEGEMAVLLRRVRRVLGVRARAVHPDLQASSYLMLSHIRDQGPLRASAMGQAFDVDKGAISRQVQHLIELGLVDRQPDPADGRATLLSLSTEGRVRLEAVAEERRKALDERLSDWTVEDLVGFAAMTQRYNDSVGLPDDR